MKRLNRSRRIAHVFTDGHLVFGGMRLRCTLGRTGIVADKREGDGGTPVGLFPVRHVHFRNRAGRPRTLLPATPVLRSHGWCDDPGHPRYNRFVRLPFPARHEKLWRGDRLYDCLIVLGQNDRPAVPERGSAVFVHVMSPAAEPTEGCVALQPGDLRRLLVLLRPGDLFRIHSPGGKTPAFPLRRACIPQTAMVG
ncbi:L,D-transpeptidase family protein [Minwuia sp.]|uniref:L,D-transpeptidase family protein n=1 Tax=Minwuia sp. TaxID=2493630 RepID=UPI003A8D8666